MNRAPSTRNTRDVASDFASACTELTMPVYSLTAYPTVRPAGSLVFNTDTSTVYSSNGLTWSVLGGGGGTVTQIPNAVITNQVNLTSSLISLTYTKLGKVNILGISASITLSAPGVCSFTLPLTSFSGQSNPGFATGPIVYISLNNTPFNSGATVNFTDANTILFNSPVNFNATLLNGSCTLTWQSL